MNISLRIVCGLTYVGDYSYGGLNPYDPRFIEWQKQVYGVPGVNAFAVDGSDGKFALAEELTRSIYQHTRYNSLISEDFFNDRFIKLRIDSLLIALQNNFSTSDIVLNDAGVCWDFAMIEHYMLGQQGIYSEIVILPYKAGSKHAAVKLILDSNEYIADPTIDGGVFKTYSEYIDHFNGWSGQKLPHDYKGDIMRGTSGSIYLKP